MTQLFQRAAYDWLALRRDPDARARERAVELLALLNHRLGQLREATVLDLGAGSGANLLWLARHLTVPQRWRLLDRDAKLLQAAARISPDPKVREVRTERRSLDDLTVEETSAVDLVTASALLDVLSFPQLERLAQTIAQAGVPALFSLSVTGEVTLQPAHGLDQELNDAFNAHQRRSGLAGPDAANYFAGQLRAAGMEVHTAATPWIVGTTSQVPQREEAFVDRYLTERMVAAIDHRAELSSAAYRWLANRHAQLHDRELEVRVEHLDLLALPS